MFNPPLLPVVPFEKNQLVALQLLAMYASLVAPKTTFSTGKLVSQPQDCLHFRGVSSLEYCRLD